MEDNKNINNEEIDIPLEELRSRYFGGRRPSRDAIQSSYNYSYSENSNGSQQWATVQNSTDPRVVDKRPKLRLICDIMLLVCVILVGLLTFASFATPVTEIGGQVLREPTQNIVDFVWRSDNSILKQLNVAFDSLSDFLGNVSTQLDSDDMIEALATDGLIGSAFKLFRLLILLVPTVILMIKTIVNIIRAIYYFYYHDSAMLSSIAITNIAKNLLLYIFFAFFGSISGGVGETEYFVGYTVGIGMTVGTIVGIAIIIAVAICNYKLNKGNVNQTTDGMQNWVKVLTCGVAFIGIAIVLSCMKMYSVFSYILNSSLTSALTSLLNGFDIKQFIFPMLNLFILVASIVIYCRIRKGFVISFKYLLLYGDTKCLNIKNQRVFNEASNTRFVSVIVLSLLSIASVYILSKPNIGLGWSVNIYNHLVIIFIISSLAQTLVAVLSTKIDWPFASAVANDSVSEDDNQVSEVTELVENKELNDINIEYRENECESVGESNNSAESVTKITLIVCPNCFAKVEDGHKFCGECGAMAKKKCPSCGKICDLTQKFCGECGSGI
ncbi:MAG: zinc ribbon domain-containing protein [Clostridia bacterium]|nr:zinc ribbon domain-containing protein [Clostridia bacterium]